MSNINIFGASFGDTRHHLEYTTLTTDVHDDSGIFL